MCGRFTLAAAGRDVAEQFDLDEVPVLDPRYNIAPTQTVFAVRQTTEGRRLAGLRWGLVPSWAKDKTIGNRQLNARCETVAEKPSYRVAFRKRRCLVPASGFFEWQKIGRKKQPILFRPNSGLFAFAGLWESWRGDEETVLETCTILTTEANEVVRPTHDRMPVIVAPIDYEAWLDPKALSAEEAGRLFRPFDATVLTATPVDPWVNDARHEGPQCVEPFREVSLF